MSTSRAAFLGALAGTISALAVYGLVTIMDARKSHFPITYVYYQDNVRLKVICMFWPAGGFEFLAATSDRHIPVMSFTYFAYLLSYILLNTLTYSVIAAIGWRCMEGAKAGLVILVLLVLAYWTLVITIL